MQNIMRTSFTRRTAIGALASAGVWQGIASAQQGAAVAGQLTEAQRYMLTSLPVNDWMAIGSTSAADVRAKLQSITNSTRGAMLDVGVSDLTGGESFTIASPGPLLGDKWLRVLSLIFSRSRELELVTFMFMRRGNNLNVEEIVNRITQKLQPYAPPILIAGTDEEASDKYYLFDIGRFVVEISVPQYGSLIPVYFTTKKTHKIMRVADNTYDKFKPYLEKTAG